MSSLCTYLPSRRSLSPLVHNKQHNDAFLGDFYILSPVRGVTKPSLIFYWGQMEKEIYKWILVYRNCFLPQCPPCPTQRIHQHFHGERQSCQGGGRWDGALATFDPLRTLSGSGSQRWGVSSPSPLPWAGTVSVSWSGRMHCTRSLLKEE